MKALRRANRESAEFHNVLYDAETGVAICGIEVFSERVSETAEVYSLFAAAPELLTRGEEFNKAAWEMVEHLMGSSKWSISDDDNSEWAQRMRRFIHTSNLHRIAITDAERSDW